MSCLLQNYCTQGDKCDVHLGINIDRCSAFRKAPLTNEGFARTCTTEELAGAIYEWYTLGYTRGKNGVKLNSITEVVEWLKEKHDGNVL